MKSVLLIGVGRYGYHLAVSLSKMGHQIMAIDKNEERINKVIPYVTSAKIGDSTSTEVLSSIGVGNYDLCIVTISQSFQDSMETTSLLQEMGAKKIVSRAETEIHGKFLLRNGADHVVFPEKQLARWTAVRYTSDNVLDFIEVDDSHGIFEVRIPENWLGKTIAKLDVRRNYDINILAVKEGSKVSYTIDPNLELTAGQTLLVLGEYRALQKCFRL